MTRKVLIIDAQAAFRQLLTHHVSTLWPDAEIGDFDPAANGQLPPGFSGAGNDIVLLGDRQDGRDALEVLRDFKTAPRFPPVLYFGPDGKAAREAATEAGADGVLARERVRHDALAVMMGDLIKRSQRVANTASLFIGDLRAGVNPIIKGYELEKRLAANEHSGVYLARRQGTEERIVLKVLRHDHDDEDGLGAFDRFLREYELIADIHHPNIVRIHDLGVGDNHAHIAMEYLAGGDLKKRMKERIAPLEAESYTRQIAGALAEIHKVGILHRDLKPGNIMLRADGSIALIDFGLAKHMRLKQEITDSGEIFGTPYYMSPEQGRGNAVDHRSDIYSLGVIFYEMLTGQKPYRADNAMGIIFKHSEEPIPLLPPHLAEYQAALNMMMAKRPGDRLQQATEVAEWLQ